MPSSSSSSGQRNLLQIIYHPIPSRWDFIFGIWDSRSLSLCRILSNHPAGPKFRVRLQFGIFVSVALLIGDYERKSTKYFMLLFLFCKTFSFVRRLLARKKNIKERTEIQVAKFKSKARAAGLSCIFIWRIYLRIYVIYIW